MINLTGKLHYNTWKNFTFSTPVQKQSAIPPSLGFHAVLYNAATDCVQFERQTKLFVFKTRV